VLWGPASAPAARLSPKTPPAAPPPVGNACGTWRDPVARDPVARAIARLPLARTLVDLAGCARLLVAGRPSRCCLHGSVKTEGCRPWVVGAETVAGVVVRSSNLATLPTHWRNRTPPPWQRSTQPARPSPSLAQPAQISHQRSPDLAASMRDISDGA
jgi:hypothetical protein